MEWKIAPMKVIQSTPKDLSNLTYPPFYFVSDEYSGNQTVAQISMCAYVFTMKYTIDGSIPFNSTGNIQLGSVVQYYRGDSAAITL